MRILMGTFRLITERGVAPDNILDYPVYKNFPRFIQCSNSTKWVSIKPLVGIQESHQDSPRLR